MSKKVIFLNNDVTYFFLHRKKFVNYFNDKNFDISYIFPSHQKKQLNKYIRLNLFNKNNSVYFFNFAKTL